MSRENARVRLETTIGQARVASDALDLYSRLAMGQIAEIANLVSTGVVQVADPQAPDGRRRASHIEEVIISDLCTQLANALGHRTGHFGIARAGMPARTAYEIQKAIDKAVADETNPGGGTVRHDGVMVRYTTLPEPTASIVETASN